MERVLLFYTAHVGSYMVLVVGVIFPMWYMAWREEVGKDFAIALRKGRTQRDFVHVVRRSLPRLRDRLYVFELDGWALLACSVMFSGVLSLSLIPHHSGLLQEDHAADAASALLMVFGLAVVFAAAAYVRWNKTQAHSLVSDHLVLMIDRLQPGDRTVSVASRAVESERKEIPMPPSGYSPDQSVSIVDFLRSCSIALEDEAKVFGRPLVVALEREIEDISRELTSGNPSPVARAVLELTREFYRQVAQKEPADSRAYRESVEVVLDEAARDILDIHVEPSAM